MKTKKQANRNDTDMPRRMFLRYACTGAASAGLLVASACHKDHKVIPDNGTDIGAGDMGIFNYIYVLKQLQTTFYQQVITTPYPGITAAELALLTAIRDHETAHSGFLKATLGSKAIISLTFDFGTINFTDRVGVIASAKLFEDTCVMACNGSAYLIQNPANLVLAGKIVSVEARHAAVIGNLLQNGYFASTDIIGSNGLNKTIDIAGGLTFVNKYLKAKVSATAFNYIIS